MVGTTILCVALGLLIKNAARYQVRKSSAKSFIESIGGKVAISGNSSLSPPGRNWLTEYLGLSNRREQLWAVDLSDTQITAPQTKKLSGCDWIRFLDLSGTNLGDDELGFLTTLTKLQELKLNRTPTTDGVIENLNELDQLLVLESKQTKLTAEGLCELDKAFDSPRFFADAKIAKMFTAISKVRNGVMVETQPRPVVKTEDGYGYGFQVQASGIELSDFDVVTSETFDLLRKLRDVRQVRGFATKNGFELSNLFRDLMQVRWISFAGGIPSSSDIQDIAKLQHLKYLYFYSTDAMPDEDVRALSRLKTVEVLSLGSLYGSLHRASLLSGFESLKVLSLSAHPQGKPKRLNDEELQHTIQLLQPLKELPNLRSLRIHGNDMQDEVLLSLIEFRNLKQIVVWMSEFLTQDAIEKFRKARPDCEVLIDANSDGLEQEKASGL